MKSSHKLNTPVADSLHMNVYLIIPSLSLRLAMSLG